MAYIETLNSFNLSTGAFVTPEMFGAVGDGDADDTAALQEAIDTGEPVVGGGTYKTSSTITVNNRNVYLKSIHAVGSGYAMSIGNGVSNSRLEINTLISDRGGGVIVETTSVCAHLDVSILFIGAYGGDAFNVAGGAGGVLDSRFSGGQWVGRDCGLRIAPTADYVGNLAFDHVRATANESGGTAIIVDSTNGAINQLHFADVSLEPASSTTSANGVLFNVVNAIEHVNGEFRATELVGKTGYILKITGAVTQQLAQGLSMNFDRLIPTKIDLSELTMSRYYALDNPIAEIHVGQFVFNGQPQATDVYIFGNKLKFRPTRKLYVTIGSDYEFPSTTYDKNPWSVFEPTVNCSLYLPSWLMEGDEVLVKPGGHTVTLKFKDFDGTEKTLTTSENKWLRVGIFRTSNLAPTIYAI